MPPARLLTLLLAVSCASLARAGADEAPVAPYDPAQHWEFDYESGVLWKFTGDATPLSYTIIPQILTVQSPLVGNPLSFARGELVIRNRFSLLVEPISMGPEHHFFGIIASGDLEWWDRTRTFCVFFTAGGGIGWLDSKGHEIKGAQGEDFNLTWLAYPGVRYVFRKGMSASAGVYFQHISNRYLNRINPGLNAIGPMMGLSWHF
jgi:lipid A 3-O-deacylase